MDRSNEVRSHTRNVRSFARWSRQAWGSTTNDISRSQRAFRWARRTLCFWSGVTAASGSVCVGYASSSVPSTSNGWVPVRRSGDWETVRAVCRYVKLPSFAPVSCAISIQRPAVFNPWDQPSNLEDVSPTSYRLVKIEKGCDRGFCVFPAGLLKRRTYCFFKW